MQNPQNKSAAATRVTTAPSDENPAGKQSKPSRKLVKQNFDLLSPTIEAEFEMAAERAKAAPVPPSVPLIGAPVAAVAARAPTNEGTREGATVRQLRGIKNDSAKITHLCTPWTYVPNVPPQLVGGSKDAYVKWRGKESTSHLLYFDVEATNPDLRPNKKSNPVRYLHAVTADYDADLTAPIEDAVLRNAPADLRANYISTTFSGGRRLLWIIDEPVPFDDVIAKRFYEVAGEALQVSSLLPGLDQQAWLNPCQPYDVGTNWRQLSEKPLSSKTVHHWLFEASKRTDWSKAGELDIPFADAQAEVEKQFGLRIEVGERIHRFWTHVNIGGNESACVVMENGMICFSRDPLFSPWPLVLGAEFARKYKADKIGNAVKDVWFDGKTYHRKIKGVWHPVAKDDFRKWLCSEQKLDDTKGKGETASEVTDAEVFVQSNRRVDGVIPCLFDRGDVKEINGKRFLNCARVKVIPPHEEPQKWPTRFPWIARFLELRFEHTERQYFLGWWKRLYCSALQGELLKGHALFIVGGVNLGKTLLGLRMVGPSVGGCVDASKYVAGTSEFNKEACEVALRCIDDGTVSSDPASHRRFSEGVKAMVANPQSNYRAMYRDAQSMEWNGRLLVTLNDDAYSLEMIPDLALSMCEKVMVLKFQNTAYAFPPKHMLERTIAAELPFFLRWLSDYEVPADIKGDNRLGVKSYINEELRLAALNAGQTGNVLEIIDLWKNRNTFESDTWAGTATDWYSQVVADEALKPLVTKFTPRGIGMKFRNAARIADSGIEVLDSDGKRNVYEIAVTYNRVRKAVRIKPDKPEPAGDQ